MSKVIVFGAGYQVINLLLLMAQALIFPRFLGLENYGLGLFLVIPVLILGGIWEPIVQRFCIAGAGIPRTWITVLIGGAGSLYVIYLISGFPEGVVTFKVLSLSAFFLIEYIFSIYFLAILQSERKYLSIFLVSLVGLCFSTLTFLIGKHFWLVVLFYSLYFFPLFVFGFCFMRHRANPEQSESDAVEKILSAISSRLFYIIINNLYVVIIGFIFGASKAAIFRVVISFCSAFRFCNPLSIGHFYSMLNKKGHKQKYLLALLPLSCFYFGVLLIWLLLPWVESYGAVVLGSNYLEVVGFFLEIAWFVPLYLWSPYLTLLFSEVLGWKEIFLVCAISLATSFSFIYADDMRMFFGCACAVYCSMLIVWGGLKIRSVH